MNQGWQQYVNRARQVTQAQQKQQYIPPAENWDYKGSPVDREGQPPPAGAQGFDALGRPYFGPGIVGTLKRYAWNFLGEPQVGLGAENWQRIVELTKKNSWLTGGSSTPEEKEELSKRISGALFDSDVRGVETDEASKSTRKGEIDEIQNKIDELAKAKGYEVGTRTYQFDPDIQALTRQQNALLSEQAEAYTTVNIGGRNISILAPLVRAAKVGTEALLDLLQEPAIKSEQLLGLQRASREYVDPQDAEEDLQAEKTAAQKISEVDEERQSIMDEKGLNATTAAFDPDIQENTRENYANIFEWARRSQLGEAVVNMIPVVSLYNWGRFFLAPGTAEQKKRALKQGWDEGRLLYSEFSSPAIQEEYRRRAEAGEDPQLLALELQNPWAEMAGQILLDPLNVIGAVSKASKMTGVIDDAADAVKTGGLVEDARFLDNVSSLENVVTGADGARAMDNFASTVKNYFYEGDELRAFTPQDYKLGSLSSDGNRVKAVREAGNVLTWGVGNIFKNGMEISDVNDWLSALVKLSSKNLDEVKEGIVAMTHFPSPKTNFGQQFLETSSLLRNLLKTEDGLDVQKLLSKIKVEGDNWTALGERLKGLLDDAASAKFPTVSELKKASEAVKDLTLKGSKIPQKTQQLADQYKQLVKTQPGLAKLAEIDELASKPKNFINKILGSFYFSYNYGYATRNAIQNNFTILADAGTKAWYRDGEFLSLKRIDEDLMKWHGGQLPPQVSGFRTLSQDLLAADKKLFGILPTGSSIANSIEIGAAKRVYYKFFRDTMESVLQPGRALPTIEDFKKIGISEQQANRLIASIKENFGDVEKAVSETVQSYRNGGPDAWRMWESYIPQELQQSMKEYGLLDEVVRITKEPSATRETIVEAFSKLKQEVKNRASSVVDDLPGKNPNTPLTQELADISAKSGSHLKDGDKASLDVMLESSYQAVDKYIEALAEVGKRTGDKDVYNLMADLARRVPDNEIRKVTKGITEKAVEVIARYRKGENPAALWAELGSPGSYSGDFVDAVWQYVKGERLPQTWGAYFDRIFSMSDELASRYGLTETMQEARMLVKQAQDFRTAEWKGLKASQAETIFTVAEEYGVKREALRNTLKKYDPNFEARTPNNQYYKPDEVREILEKRAGLKGQPSRMVPPQVHGATPSPSRAWAESAKGALSALDFTESKMLANWGIKSVEGLDPQAAVKLTDLMRQTKNRLAEAQLIAQRVGEYWRDFALLPYGQTTNLDHALSYVYPYSFWYSRSYAGWAKRLVSDPQIIAAYAKFKDTMIQLHKDSPEWWKYNVPLPEFMWGLNNGNPMFINLEAAVWPLYGLTGVDFNDPQKRTNWFTSLVDDLGKFGPSVWAPINMAIAAGLALQGEDEAASRWGGRLIPQTATFKAIQAQLGFTPTELDPAVRMFSGNLDPYEESRALRALAAMQEDGIITDEQAIELAYRQEGPLWDEAVLRATRLRGPGQIASFFLGVGFKARTDQDLQMDSFYQDYFRMKNLHQSGYMSDEQYKQGFNELREKYPFMDTVLLGRRAGDGRESAYAYNVISRIPPGMSSELYDVVGVDHATAEKFFESGGNMEGWNEQEKSEFMTAMVNLGAIIAIPQNATRFEWTEAKNQYKQVNDAVTAEYGEDIQNMIDDYFGFSDRGEAQVYAQRYPEVLDALDMQNQLISQNPLLLKYYGGIDTLERYYVGQMYDQLEDKYGVDTMNAARVYSATINKETKAQILKEHPELRDYWDDRAEMSADNLRRVADLGKFIPEVELETYGDPQNPTQEDILDFAQTPPRMTYQEFNQVLGPSMMALIEDFRNGQDFEYSTERTLDYYAERLGYQDRDDLVRDVLVAQ